MANHTPRLCNRCGGPMTATGQCTRCAHATVARARRRDPLMEIREALMPWIRGQVRCW